MSYNKAYNTEWARARRNKLKDAGLCVKCGKEKPALDKAICLACSKKHADCKSRRIEKRMEQGLCINCGKKPPVPNRLSCENCLQVFRDRTQYSKENGICANCHKRKVAPGNSRCPDCITQGKENYNFRKENGICVKCGTSYALDDMIFCEKCIFKNLSQGRKSRATVKSDHIKYEEHLEKARNREKDIRQARIDNGLCPDCGGPLVNDDKICARCLRSRKKRGLKYLENKRPSDFVPRQVRFGLGLCYYCSRPVLNGVNSRGLPYRTCEICRDRGAKNASIATDSKHID